ncbi:MAG TPA: YqaJ viral recombinase family protein [Beijerinckiaceae bacterium]|nr:YqaJ viral recombinase family protein [Beijerinckiaceae bacterium]
MKIFTCEQGSIDWYQARAGMPTASHFKDLFIGPRGGQANRRTYMLRLAGEILTGEPMEQIWNGHMERGRIMENEARNFYALDIGMEPERVGFIRNDRASGPVGCSPDSLVGSDGALEIKTAMPHILLEAILKDAPPAEHVAQCQGILWVAEREWIDLSIYWPRLPPFVKRLHRDQDFIDSLVVAVDAFNEELQEIVERVRRYGRDDCADMEAA